MALPRVLRSADAARDAFAALRAAPGRAHPAGPVVVLSTVKGDLHDIGKNLVGMVLEAAGFDVLDLGTDRSAADIAAAAAEAGALAVGVSGLLTRSLAEMERVAASLALAGSDAVLLCGGAAVDGDYVAERIEPRRPGLVAFARDPFEAAALLETLRTAPSGCGTCAPAPRARARGAAAPAPSAASAAPVAAPPVTGSAKGPAAVEGPAFVPPFTGSAELAPIPFDRLVGALDVHAVVRSRWGYRDEAEGRAALDEAVASLRAAGGVQASCRYGFYRTRKTGPESVEFSDGSGKAVSFGFPREAGEDGRSVADYYADDDAAAAFCVTLGRRAGDYLAGLKSSGDSAAYLRGHGLLAGLAEAAAEIAHRRIAEELTGRGACPDGKRYSFGFPGCPGVESNAALLGLLAADRVGLRATSGHQLDPEFSVTAIIVQRAAARYIRATAKGEDHA